MRGRVMGTIVALPRDQHESFRRKIEREILELELRIVPGISRGLRGLLNEQLLALESKLKPLDDKRNPRHFRSRRRHVESSPVWLWNKDDYCAAAWGARDRAKGVCEICAAGPVEITRISVWPPNTMLTRHHCEAVCALCADQHPRECYTPSL